MGQKWHINIWGYQTGTEIEKKCSPLPSIFDIEAPFQRYLPESEILAILANSHLRSTLIFQNIWFKFGQIVRVTKKMILTYIGAEPQSRNGEKSVFASGQNRKMGHKSIKKKNLTVLFCLHSFSRRIPEHGDRKKVNGSEIRIFGQKSMGPHFFSKDHRRA